MKRLFSLVIAIFVVATISAQQVTIKGRILKYSGEDSLTFQIVNSKQPVNISIPVSKKGDFSYTYTEPTTNYCNLFFNTNDVIPLILSAGETAVITAEYGNLNKTVIIGGSPQTKSLLDNFKDFEVFRNEADAIQLDFNRRMDSLQNAHNNRLANEIRQNPANYGNLMLIQALDAGEFLDVYLLLDSVMMATYPQSVIVKEFHDNVSRFTTLREGSQIPEILLKDAQGKEIKLSDFRGKIVLVDFWASWCRPCRMEIKNFKIMYNAYKNYGFDIYSISTDNDRNAWLRALDQEKMDWTNVHDSQNVYSTMFNVTTIPFTILIDAQGKIVAKNLRGTDLDEKIRSLLNNNGSK